MNNNLTPESKNTLEKDIRNVWHRASSATLVMSLGSLVVFLIVFLFVFFLARNRLEASLVIPVALFVSLIFMFVSQVILRMFCTHKRKNSHA